MVQKNGTASMRIIAAILSVVVILASFPISAFAEIADVITITVTDSESVQLDDANVSYEIKVNDEIVKTGTEVTVDGVAEISDLAECLENIGETDEVLLLYTVEKDGYEKYSSETTIDSSTSNIDVTLVEDDSWKESVKVTVNKSGNGKVELNGKEENNYDFYKGDVVVLNVTAGEKSFIKSITLDETPVEIGKVTTYTAELTLEENLEINVVFAKEYTVSVSAQDGGTISLNGGLEETLSVEEGTKITYSVVPMEGYQISNVTVNGETCSVSDVYNFSDEITVNKDTSISASFIKEYKVTVTVKGENGKVKLDKSYISISEENPDGVGSVVIKEDRNIALIATPSDNYRVSKVVKNGEETCFEENDKNYAETVKNEDAVYEITFSPNVHSVTVKECQNGTAELKIADKIEYGKSNELTITPDEGYKVSSVKVNGTEVTKDYLLSTGDAVEKISNDASVLKISKITKDTEFEVMFAEAEKVELDEVKFNSEDAVRVSDDLTQYVFSNDAVVKFETESSGLVINDADASDAYKTNSYEITESTIIENIKIFKYENEDDVFGAWHEVVLEKPIEIVIDKTAPSASLIPDAANENGYYNKNVFVEIVAMDSEVFSGIKSVKYSIGYIDKAGVVNKPLEMIEITDLNGDSQTKRAMINVDAKENNRKDTLVFVEVTDLAGNVYTNDSEPLSLNINVSTPEVSVSVDGTPHEEAYTEGEYRYYNDQRKATITINDREDTFDPGGLKLEITAVDAQNNPIDIDVHGMLGSWKNSGDIHQAELTFEDNAIYEWTVSYTNKAGTSNLFVNSNEKESPFKFVVDKEAPIGEIETDGTVWKDIVSTLTFGIWSNDKLEIMAKGEDRISPVYPVVYYKSISKLNRSELVEAYDNGLFTETPYVVDTEEEFIVYARVMDYAGNAIYVSTDGLIVEMTSSTVELTPEKANKNGLYNDDVTVDIYVSEIKEGNTYSGIKNIEYWVLNDGVETQRQILFDYSLTKGEDGIYTIKTIDWATGKEVTDEVSGKVPTKEQLKTEWKGSIVVDSEKNNGCHTEVYVKTTDNAGNEKIEKIKLDIDVVKPIVELTYDNNDGNEYKDGKWYFDADRTATITVYERHFDADAATKAIKIKADVKGEPVEIVLEDLVVGETWKESLDAENPDMNKYTLTLSFSKDATYSIEEIVYTDRADNTNESPVDIKDSVSPYNFTVDKVNPQGSVTLNENSWNKIVEVLTFGLYSQTEISVEADAYDVTSPVDIYYYESSSDFALTEDDLDNIDDEWKEFTPYVIENNRQVAVYLKVIDAAGNWTYVSSDGYIIDKTAPQINLAALTEAKGIHNNINIYNGDVEVQIVVNDEIGEVIDGMIPYSGIKKIEYSITSEGVETQSWTTLFDFEYVRNEGENSNGGSLKITDMSSGEPVVTEYTDATVPTHDMLKKVWTGNIIVDSNKNNACHVNVLIRVTDNAGNTSDNISDPFKLDIDIVQPEIEISYDNNSSHRGSKYFNANRTATIKVYERTGHFDEQKFIKSVEIEATDANGAPVLTEQQKLEMFGEAWEHKENAENRDKDEHTITISYTTDANYTFAIKTPATETTEAQNGYVDEAGNISKTPDTLDSVAPYEFTVDKTAPTGKVKATADERPDNPMVKDTLVKDLTFGFWSNKGIAVSTDEVKDETSPIESVTYYKSNTDTAMTETELNTIENWTSFDKDFIKVSPNEQFAVYVRIIDMAGNMRYVSTDGLIADNIVPREESFAPNVEIKASEDGIYNGDIVYDIIVTDPEEGGTYSGLKTISYKVYNMGENVTQEETLYKFSNEAPTRADLLQTWTGKITVNSELNNSNDIVVEVFAEDNALNSAKFEESAMIDITAPKIDVEYDNNIYDSGKYYKETRTAKITITERNFAQEDVVITVKKDGLSYAVNPSWSSVGGTGNMDDTKNIATIEYYEDGDYTFDMSYTDSADNPADGVSYQTSTNPTEFTIDRTLPEISVRYNNNSAQNGKYFNAHRIATITVVEHNFDPNRVELSQIASINGAPISSPGISSWSNSGDIHTATISYTADGDYLFDIKALDLAGNLSGDANYGDSVASKDFTIDTTISAPIITGVSSGKSYPEDVSFTASASDINYNSGNVELLRTRRGDKGKNVTADLTTGFAGTGNGGTARNKNFEMIKENDGIYTLTARCTDLAGNSATSTVTFTVNRFGSVYSYDDYLVSLQDSYIQNVDKPLVITEYNPDKLVADSVDVEITRNGAPIQNVEYEVSPVINNEVSVGESGWYQYEYTIAPSNFAEDGVYKITISSEDSAGNRPETSSSDEDGEKDDIVFRVDTTPARLTRISGLEEPIVNAENLTVEYEVFDAIGIKQVTVYVNDKPLHTYDSFEDLINFKSSFMLAEGAGQKIKFVVEDLAGNITDTSSAEFESAIPFEKEITVSTNLFVRWYANKPLFWGSIGGTAALLGILLILLIVLKKKRDKKA